LNDYKDQESDKLHPTKKTRPIAAGLIKPNLALAVGIVLLVLSFIIAGTINRNFFITLGIYLILTIGYTLKLKKVMILDLILITAFYLIRIIAGGFASKDTTSYWMFGFSIFFFLSLAFAKRFAELKELEQANSEVSNRRGYQFGDETILLTLGVAAGYAAVVIFALYLNTPTINTLYKAPEIMWGLLPVLTYWISWIWLQASRGNMYEDPLLFAFDRNESRIAFLVGAILVLLASVIHLKSGFLLVQN
jgi:4-hydroxybenzoate polyprenyltransferase